MLSITALFFLILFSRNSSEKLISPIEKSIEKITSPIFLLTQKDLGLSNDYAIGIKNLKTDEAFFHNENVLFNSASLYKIWVMGTAFGEISKGAMSEDEKLSASLEDIQIKLEISTKSAEEKPKESEDKTITYTLGDALEKMIAVSDNYAAVLMASRSGNQNVVNFMKNYGLNDSLYTPPPMTTAEDIATLLEKMYKGQVVSIEYSQRMLDILKRQKLNDRIPKYLPEDVLVAHKTGELGRNKHDVGIVFSKSGDYIFVVLSKTDDPMVAAENIAKFSLSIYNYFNPKTKN